MAVKSVLNAASYSSMVSNSTNAYPVRRLFSSTSIWMWSLGIFKAGNQQKIENLNRKIICFKSYSFLTWEQLHNICFINRPWETSDLNHFTFIGLWYTRCNICVFIGINLRNCSKKDILEFGFNFKTTVFLHTAYGSRVHTFVVQLKCFFNVRFWCELNISLHGHILDDIDAIFTVQNFYSFEKAENIPFRNLPLESASQHHVKTIGWTFFRIRLWTPWTDSLPFIYRWQKYKVTVCIQNVFLECSNLFEISSPPLFRWAMKLKCSDLTHASASWYQHLHASLSPLQSSDASCHYLTVNSSDAPNFGRFLRACNYWAIYWMWYK